MQDRPDIIELLSAVSDFLTDDVMPELEGRKRFHARVAANLLGIAKREIMLEPGHRVIDGQALQDLLQEDGDVETLKLAFVDRLRKGELDSQEPDVLATLRDITQRKLAVANPSYILSPAS